METKKTEVKTRNRVNEEKGYTLLEYAAGAAVILAIIYVAMFAMGQNLGNLFDSIGNWATDRANQIDQASAGTADTGRGGNAGNTTP